MGKFVINSINFNLLNNLSLSTFLNQSIGTNEQHAVYSFLKNWFDNKPFIIQKTSGSTGKPKNIKLYKHVLQKSAEITNTQFNITNTSVLLNGLPVEYIAGKMMVLRALIAKCHLIIVEPKLNILENWQETTIDFTALTPLMVKEILSNPNSAKKLNCFKTVILGGSAVSDSLKLKLKKLKPSFYETYGMTETASHIAIKNLKENSAYFTCLSDYTVKLNNSGQLILNLKSLLGKNILTNDLAIISTPKSFKIIGRTDFMINSGGVKLNPEIIEVELQKVFNAIVYVSSVSSKLYGEKLIAVFNKLPNNTTLKKGYAKLSNKLFIPKNSIEIKEFPLLPSGKIDRLKLREIIRNQESLRDAT